MLNLRRRQWIGYASATAAGLGLTRPALAQFAGSEPPSCPPGWEWSELSFTTAPSNYEASISATVGKLSGKYPSTVTLWSGKCKKSPPPKPPKPPEPPRKPGSGLWDPYNFSIQEGFVDWRDSVLITSGNLYWDVGMPGFMSLASSTARVLVRAQLSNGQMVSSSHLVVRDMNGYRLSNPSALDHWNATVASTAISGSYELSGLQMLASTAGSAPYGVALYLGDTIVGSQSRTVTAKVGGGGGSQID